MASSSIPWPRILIFVLIILGLAWWLHQRDLGGEPDAPTLPADGIGRPAAVDGRVVVDVLAYDVAEGETPGFWIRIGNDAWDVDVVPPDAPEDVRRRADRRRASVLEDVREELADLRRESQDTELVGEIRRSAEVPAFLSTAVFQAFIEAGYGAVDMVSTEARPPGPLHR